MKLRVHNFKGAEVFFVFWGFFLHLDSSQRITEMNNLFRLKFSSLVLHLRKQGKGNNK